MAPETESGTGGSDSFGASSVEWMEHLPGVDGWIEAASERMRRVSRLLGSILIDVARRNEISPGDWECLSVLQRSGASRECTQKELAEKLGLTSGTVSVRVDRLTAAGLIEPGSARDDGRNRPVRLSGRGSEVWRRATEERTGRESSLYVSALDKNELKQLNHLLGKLLARFESELGPAPSQGSLRREAG